MANFLTGPAQSPPSPAVKEAVTLLTEAKKSGKAAESKASSSLGADVSGKFLEADQIVQQLSVTTPGPVSALDGNGLPGGGDAKGGSNIASTPPGYPTDSGSRAPVTG